MNRSNAFNDNDELIEVQEWLSEQGEDFLPIDYYEAYDLEDYFVDEDDDGVKEEKELPNEAKLVLVVNNSLKMGKGKIAAQCAHATLGSYIITKQVAPKTLRWWKMLGQAKIVVKAESEEEIDSLINKARSSGVVSFVIQDEGRTQVAPGSRTVLALGPAPVGILNDISGHLKLV